MKKLVKLMALYVIVLMTLTCCDSNHSEVTFVDSNFEQIIRNTIGKPTGPIYPKDCESIASLDIKNSQITDLSGIEQLSNLSKLHLQNNEISNITALRNLTSLTELSIESNQISDITASKRYNSIKQFNKSNRIKFI